MSVPHTGQLTAEIHGALYQFNGDEWTGADAPTVATLNTATAATAKTHYNIRELAERIFLRTGLAGTVRDWRADQWDEAIGEDALD